MRTLKESLNDNEIIILSDTLPSANVPDNIRIVVNGAVNSLYDIKPDSLFITGERLNNLLMPNTIKQIYFDDTINSIIYHSCAGCMLLEKVIILGKIDMLQSGCFYYCKSLKEIVLPEYLKFIENNCFMSCRLLEEITIPKGVRRIGDRAFDDCRKLKEITIPNGVEVIGNMCFANCKSLKKITIPKSVVSIGRQVFIGCTSLKRIKCTNRVKELLLKDKTFLKSTEFNIIC